MGLDSVGAEIYDIHGYFHRLMVGQWPPGFWDVTKLIDSLEFFKCCYKLLLYDLSHLQVNVIALVFRVLIFNIIVQPNLLGELRVITK